METFLTRDSREISYELRKSVLDRDGHQCRYCGTKEGPFHIDHVYPHIKGGVTSYENLVTACAPCNQSKHAHVGMWPKPLGYFRKRHSPYITLITLVGVVAMMNGAMALRDGDGIAAGIVFLCGVAVAVLSIGWNLTRS
jgi:hypothetical protein